MAKTKEMPKSSDELPEFRVSRATNVTSCFVDFKWKMRSGVGVQHSHPGHRLGHWAALDPAGARDGRQSNESLAVQDV